MSRACCSVPMEVPVLQAVDGNLVRVTVEHENSPRLNSDMELLKYAVWHVRYGCVTLLGYVHELQSALHPSERLIACVVDEHVRKK